MESKIYLWEQYRYEDASEAQKKTVGRNPCYDLTAIRSEQMREELAGFIRHRCRQACIVTVYGEHQYFQKVCHVLRKYEKRDKSLQDAEAATWMRRMKAWMFQEGIPISRQVKGHCGRIYVTQARELQYLENLLKYVSQTAQSAQPEREKDIWQLDRLDIPFRANPIKNTKTLNFTKIFQEQMREEIKKGIYLNLQSEAIRCIQQELTAMRRLSRFLKEKYPTVQSCRELNRELIEEYLTYLKTESTGTKHFHADLNRLRAVLESVGQVCDYPNLIGLFLTRDIPPTPKAAFKTYSDAEMIRLNAAILKMDEQIARLMIIHQMLGTRISDTLTLEPNCLYQKDGEDIIRISQMKTSTYQKPISAELAALIRKAIAYTMERYGETKYIFVNEKDRNRPMQYNMVQTRVTEMIYKEDLRDDNGDLFGFNTHMYRHYYGAKLAEMYLDDWTIAKMLGHSSVRNVKYYRKLSDQLLADDTRRGRKKISDLILSCLDGWEDEYEQIRQNGSLQ